MSAVATKLITAEEFAEMPERDDGAHDELIRGKIVVIEPINKATHGLCVTAIIMSLGNYLKRKSIGRAFCRCGVVLFRDPDTVRAPDLLYYSFARMPRIPDGYFESPPDLAIEVISPDDRRELIGDKLRDYLAAGVRLVWLVDPESHTVMVYTGNTRGVEYVETDTLDGGDVLSGFTCPVADLFG